MHVRVRTIWRRRVFRVGRGLRVLLVRARIVTVPSIAAPVCPSKRRSHSDGLFGEWSIVKIRVCFAATTNQMPNKK